MKQMQIFIMMIIFACACPGEVRAQWTVSTAQGGWMPDIPHLTDVVMLDSMTAVAVGLDYEILLTSNGGETWINWGSVVSVLPPIHNLVFFDAKNGILVGDNSRVFTTPNGGKNWALNYGLLQIKVPWRNCLSAVYAGATNIYVGADSGWIYHTLDGGKTWSSEKVSEYPIRSMFAWRGTYAMGLPLYALTPHSILTKTEFPPSAWIETPLPAFQGPGCEAFDGEFSNGGGPGFLVGVQGDKRMAPMVLRRPLSSDTTWESSMSGIQMDGAIYGISALSEKVVYLCGTGGSIYRSGDGGLTWSRQSTPTTKTLRAIMFFDERHGIAVGDSGIILRTTNGGITSVRPDDATVPLKFRLEQNYPNPFNPSTRIVYDVPERADVKIEIFDLAGRSIRLLADGDHQPGRHSVEWNGMTSGGHEASSGVYFCRMRAGTYRSTVKLILAR